MKLVLNFFLETYVHSLIIYPLEFEVDRPLELNFSPNWLDTILYKHMHCLPQLSSEYVLNIMEMLLICKLAQNLVKESAQIELVKKCFKHNYPNLLYKITINYNLCTCFENTKRGIDTLVFRDNCTNNLGVMQPNKLRCIPFEKLECSNFDMNLPS